MIAFLNETLLELAHILTTFGGDKIAFKVILSLLTKG